MKRYQVSVHVVVPWTVDVEASSADEAAEKVRLMNILQVSVDSLDMLSKGMVAQKQLSDPLNEPWRVFDLGEGRNE